MVVIGEKTSARDNEILPDAGMSASLQQKIFQAANSWGNLVDGIAAIEDEKIRKKMLSFVRRNEEKLNLEARIDSNEETAKLLADYQKVAADFEKEKQKAEELKRKESEAVSTIAEHLRSVVSRFALTGEHPEAAEKAGEITQAIMTEAGKYLVQDFIRIKKKGDPNILEKKEADELDALAKIYVEDYVDLLARETVTTKKRKVKQLDVDRFDASPGYDNKRKTFDYKHTPSDAEDEDYKQKNLAKIKKNNKPVPKVPLSPTDRTIRPQNTEPVRFVISNSATESNGQRGRFFGAPLETDPAMMQEAGSPGQQAAEADEERLEESIARTSKELAEARSRYVGTKYEAGNIIHQIKNTLGVRVDSGQVDAVNSRLDQYRKKMDELLELYTEKLKKSNSGKPDIERGIEELKKYFIAEERINLYDAFSMIRGSSWERQTGNARDKAAELARQFFAKKIIDLSPAEDFSEENETAPTVAAPEVVEKEESAAPDSQSPAFQIDEAAAQAIVSLDERIREISSQLHALDQQITVAQGDRLEEFISRKQILEQAQESLNFSRELNYIKAIRKYVAGGEAKNWLAMEKLPARQVLSEKDNLAGKFFAYIMESDTEDMQRLKIYAEPKEGETLNQWIIRIIRVGRDLGIKKL